MSSCASSLSHGGASLSSILCLGCILYCKDEEYNVYITPSQGGEEEYTAYSYYSSPHHGRVHGLLLVRMRIRSMMPTPLQGGEDVLWWLLVIGV